MKHKLFVTIDEFSTVTFATKLDPEIVDYIDNCCGLILELDIDEERMHVKMFDEEHTLDLKGDGHIQFNA